MQIFATMVIVIFAIAIVLMLTRCSLYEKERKIEIIRNDTNIKIEESDQPEVDEEVLTIGNVDIKDGEYEVVSYKIEGYENGKKHITINCKIKENEEVDLKAYQDRIELLRSEEIIQSVDQSAEWSFKFELRNMEDEIELVFEKLNWETLEIEEKRISFDIKNKGK